MAKIEFINVGHSYDLSAKIQFMRWNPSPYLGKMGAVMLC